MSNQLQFVGTTSSSHSSDKWNYCLWENSFHNCLAL